MDVTVTKNPYFFFDFYEELNTLSNSVSTHPGRQAL